MGIYPRGDGTSRLVLRMRSNYSWKPGDPLFTLFLEPGHFVMERKMMRTLRQRAEALARQQRTRAPVSTPPSAPEFEPQGLH